MWSYCLYGMLIIQLCKMQGSLFAELTRRADTYCNQFPNDRLQLKLLGSHIPAFGSLRL